MEKLKLELFWSELPIGKENAVSYKELCPVWGMCEREVRRVLHELSCYDNGDDYILIRSAKGGGGFYRSDNPADMKSYKAECLAKGRSVFAPVKKINRVLNANTDQVGIKNNLRVIREEKGLKQRDVCQLMKKYDVAIDKSLLSKMENSICLPTPYQLSKLAEIYECSASQLVATDLY